MVLVSPEGIIFHTDSLRLACPSCGGDGMSTRFVPELRESVCHDCRRRLQRQAHRRRIKQPWEQSA